MHKEDILGTTFSGVGAPFQQYGKLNEQASGWSTDKVERLLELRISVQEMDLPDQLEPRLDASYISKHLSCLPEDLRHNMRRQGVKKRRSRIESYFGNTYGYIPPRVRRHISGLYHHNDRGLPALRRTA